METTIKQYGGNRPTEEIKAAVKANGWFWDQRKYDQGSDFVVFQRNDHEVVYNTCSGRFITKHHEVLVTEESTEYENEDWYKFILDFIYIPLETA
jgi:hypothetical protein